MQIELLTIKNLRSIRETEFPVLPLTTLIGENNAGKSTILRAIELFFEAAPKVTRDDFHCGNEDQPIEITIGFTRLTPAEVEEFGSAVIDGKLLVSRQLMLNDRESGQYSARAMIYPEFSEVRAETNGTKKRSLHNALASKIDDLPSVGSYTEVDAVLSEWEKNHSDLLKAEYLRGFFGAPNVANGKLKKKTSVHLVPAVRDAAAESADPKKSPILSLLSDISRQILDNKKEMSEFPERAKMEFDELSNPDNVPQLNKISDYLTESIQRFYSDAKLNAIWEHGEGLSVSYPIPKIAIEDRGVATDLSRVGHGLQRAALFSIVQFLAEQVNTVDLSEGEPSFIEPASDIIILVEEPEIYQHPSKQTVINRAFKELASEFNRSTGIRMQLIYTTHSEKFITMENFQSARIVRRVNVDGVTRNFVSDLKMKECIEDFANFFDPPKDPMSEEAFVAKLHIFSREVCEGFFARKVILVEGVTDRAVFEGMYKARARDVHEESIAVIAVDGKNKMDKPGYIFSRLGIPTYMVFDNDVSERENKQRKQTNILLQKIWRIDDPIEMPEGVFERFAAFGGNLEKYLKERIGEDWSKFFNAVCEDYGLGYDELKKTPDAITKVVWLAEGRGCKFPEIDEIIQKVDELLEFGI